MKNKACQPAARGPSAPGWILAALLGLSGCDGLPRSRPYDQSRDYQADAQRRLDRANLQMTELAAERDRAVNRTGQLEQQLAGRGEVEEILEKRVDNLRRENDRLHAELTGVVLSSAGRRTGAPIINASGSVPAGFELPKELLTRLTEFAGRHEGVTFDPADRVLRFPATRLFVSEGDRLTEEARGWMRELAGILSSPPARKLIVQVVGHSSSRARLPAELSAQHPTDWHLTAHQAIAVEQQLEEFGVAPVRLGIVGYAGQQPLIEGADAKRLNARIEVYLLPDLPERG